MNYGFAKYRVSLSVLVLLSCLLALCCNSPEMPSSKQVGDGQTLGAVAKRLHEITAGETLSDLRWPDFTDHRHDVQRLYEAVNYAPVWIRDEQPTPQALAVIAALESSQQKGLNPEDYDASRWSPRLNILKTARGNADMLARFDAALTVSTMRYISDLHIGRVNPKPLKFGINLDQKNYDLTQFLS